MNAGEADALDESLAALLAACDEALGQEALPMLQETLRLNRIKQGPDHPNTLICLRNLATVYQAADRPGEAVPLFEEVLRRSRAKQGGGFGS